MIAASPPRLKGPPELLVPLPEGPSKDLNASPAPPESPPAQLKSSDTSPRTPPSTTSMFITNGVAIKLRQPIEVPQRNFVFLKGSLLQMHHQLDSCGSFDIPDEAFIAPGVGDTYLDPNDYKDPNDNDQIVMIIAKDGSFIHYIDLGTGIVEYMESAIFDKSFVQQVNLPSGILYPVNYDTVFTQVRNVEVVDWHERGCEVVSIF